MCDQSPCNCQPKTGTMRRPIRFCMFMYMSRSLSASFTLSCHNLAWQPISDTVVQTILQSGFICSSLKIENRLAVEAHFLTYVSITHHSTLYNFEPGQSIVTSTNGSSWTPAAKYSVLNFFVSFSSFGAAETSSTLGWLVDPVNQDIYVFKKDSRGVVRRLKKRWKNVAGGDVVHFR